MNTDYDSIIMSSNISSSTAVQKTFGANLNPDMRMVLPVGTGCMLRNERCAKESMTYAGRNTSHGSGSARWQDRDRGRLTCSWYRSGSDCRIALCTCQAISIAHSSTG